jgi:hypothetical protein
VKKQSPPNRGLTRRQALAGAAALGSVPAVVAGAPEAAAAGRPPAHDLRRMLAEISAKNIERTILKLVSFGTRNTL